MNKKTLTAGTRSSQLALWQADYVLGRLQEQYPDVEMKKELLTTKGDKILDAPLAKIGGKGLFTKELEEAMLAGKIDFAVHSLKDMPTEVPEGLVITAITSREDPGDAFVSNQYNSFQDLPQGARVGTSSLRRKAQLLAVRPDLEIADLRGNVNTRLRKLDEGQYDGVILACAGLKRLGFGERIRQVLDKEICLPAVGQGALAIEARENDDDVRSMLAFLDDEESRLCTEAERGFLKTVQGGCQVPVGVYGTYQPRTGTISLEAIIASLDGKKLLRRSIEKKAADVQTAQNIGRELADDLLDMGGREILQSIGIEV